MQAMVLHEPAPAQTGPLRLEERPVPEPGPGEVRLRVHCCAVCRTDLHVVEGDLPRQTLPIVPGHQVVGTVEALGEGCSLLAEGQRVGVAWLRRTCGECIYCRAGRENLCRAPQFTGYHADGGYAEQVLVPEAFAYPIPAGFADTEAAPLLCGGIIGYRALERAEVPPGGSLAVFGFGSSAHVVIQLARSRGCSVYVVSRTRAHQAHARRLGAAWAGSDAANLPEAVDSAIVFAPVGTVVPPALAALKPGGTCALAGIHMTPVPQLDYERHLFHERNLRSVTANTRADGRALLDEAAAVPVRPDVTVYPLAEANRALQHLAAGRLRGTAVLQVAS